MPEEPQEQPTREQLVEAREQLEAQIEILQNPARSSDRNPPLIARLRSLLNEINETLAARESNGV
jgi:hypothetical protein